jgi:hypothetical protein
MHLASTLPSPSCTGEHFSPTLQSWANGSHALGESGVPPEVTKPADSSDVTLVLTLPVVTVVTVEDVGVGSEPPGPALCTSEVLSPSASLGPLGPLGPQAGSRTAVTVILRKGLMLLILTQNAIKDPQGSVTRRTPRMSKDPRMNNLGNSTHRTLGNSTHRTPFRPRAAGLVRL